MQTHGAGRGGAGRGHPAPSGDSQDTEVCQRSPAVIRAWGGLPQQNEERKPGMAVCLTASSRPASSYARKTPGPVSAPSPWQQQPLHVAKLCAEDGDEDSDAGAASLPHGGFPGSCCWFMRRSPSSCCSSLISSLAAEKICSPVTKNPCHWRQYCGMGREQLPGKPSPSSCFLVSSGSQMLGQAQ